MLNIRIQNQNNRLKPRITVVGVGGAGGNAVNNMINSHLEGCEFLVCNTDAQALEGSSAPHKIQLGANVTRGLGAGANPEIGRAAAEESMDDIMSILDGSNMVFVTAGMGGGTGTGAAPIVAQAAREAGILTVGVITKPFHFEGTHRMKLAEAGIAELQKYVDTLIIIPNQNLFRIANEKTTFADAFRMADEVLQSGVRGVTDLMVMPGLINLDFADIRAVMAEMGKAMMGTGEATGERRAVEAAEAAISNPLLDDISMKGARGVLINITGGLDMTLFEVDEAANRIRDEVDPDANIIFGSTFDASMDGKMRVSVVATGIEADQGVQARPLGFVGAVVEPARRMGPAVPSFGRGAGATAARADFMTGAPPSSVIPSYNTSMVGGRSFATAQRGEDKASAGGAADMAMMGHAAATAPAWSAAATARKLDENDTPTMAPAPSTPATAKSPLAGLQPRGERHGTAFIPPKPVDPRSASTAGDLFGDEPRAGVTKPAAEKPAVKKSPSLFERFTLQRGTEEPEMKTPPRVETSTAPRLAVETGGRSEEDELDIPAFLRRQAN